MNKICWPLLFLLIICSCKHEHHPTSTLSSSDFVIEGTVEQLEGIKLPVGAKIWLVPFFGPHPRPVDSCFVAEDGSFRFEGNTELLSTIILGQAYRYGYQQLLVCTSPGTTRVTIGERSSASGTPMNDDLQVWKEYIEAYNDNLLNYAKVYKEGAMNATTYKAETERLGQQAGEFVYQFLKQRGSNTLTRGLNTMRFGSLTPEQRAELDELLRDTTDYTLPQLGYHR